MISADWFSCAGPVTSKKGGAKPAAKVAKGRQRPPAAGLPAAGGQLRHQSSSNSLNAAALQRGTADSQHLLQVSSGAVPMAWPAPALHCVFLSRAIGAGDGSKNGW